MPKDSIKNTSNCSDSKQDKKDPSVNHDSERRTGEGRRKGPSPLFYLFNRSGDYRHQRDRRKSDKSRENADAPVPEKRMDDNRRQKIVHVSSLPYLNIIDKRDKDRRE